MPAYFSIRQSNFTSPHVTNSTGRKQRLNLFGGAVRQAVLKTCPDAPPFPCAVLVGEGQKIMINPSVLAIPEYDFDEKKSGLKSPYFQTTFFLTFFFDFFF